MRTLSELKTARLKERLYDSFRRAGLIDSEIDALAKDSQFIHRIFEARRGPDSTPKIWKPGELVVDLSGPPRIPEALSAYECVKHEEQGCVDLALVDFISPQVAGLTIGDGVLIEHFIDTRGDTNIANLNLVDCVISNRLELKELQAYEILCAGSQLEDGLVVALYFHRPFGRWDWALADIKQPLADHHRLPMFT
jgi:hypothetical protein